MLYDMTSLKLASCALSLPSPQANIGQMDTAKEMWKMIMGNLALIQVRDTTKSVALIM